MKKGEIITGQQDERSWSIASAASGKQYFQRRLSMQ
jgi:hypothetical protein